jgi:hypothetical protein
MERKNLVLFMAASFFFSLTHLAGRGGAEEHTRRPVRPQLNFRLSWQQTEPRYGVEFGLDRASLEETGHTLKKSPPKHLGRAVLECFALFAYSQTKYWLTYGDWIDDWHYELTWEDQKKRFFSLEAWKFDSNCFGLNWSHALAGALYYNFARTSNLNRAESLLFTVGGSFYWEYIAEWRNVISIGDNIFTIFGGFSVGEAWYQLGKRLTNRAGLVNRLLSFANPVLKFNRWLDRKELAGSPKEPEPGWEKFEFFLGGRFSRQSVKNDTAGYLHAGIHTQIIHPTEYGKPGQVSQKNGDTLFSELYLDFSAGSGGTEEVNLFSRTVFFGYLKQSIDPQQRGYACFFGLGSAFAYFKKRSTAFYDGCEVKVRRGYDLQLEEPRDFKDKFSVVHLAGPVFDLTRISPEARLRLVLEAYLDFALINAFALNKYSETHDLSGVKTNLLYYGYYYGFGTTLGSELNIAVRNLEFDGLLKYHSWGSIDGRDRFQDELTDDFHVRDARWQFKLEMGVWIPGTPTGLFSSYESIQREGKIKETDHKQGEIRWSLGLKCKF